MAGMAAEHGLAISHRDRWTVRGGRAAPRDAVAQPERMARVLERLGERAMYLPVEGGDRSFRVRGARADDREVGASLAPLAAPFVRRVAGGG